MFLVLHVVATAAAPSTLLASCTAMLPTPPLPPKISTRCPAFNPP